MTRTVIFTGAGASAAFGYPLTSQLLPNIRKALAEGDAFEGVEPVRKKNDELTAFLNAMLPGFRVVNDKNLPFITDILSLVDYSLQVSSTPIRGSSPERLIRFRRLLEEAIFHDILDDFDDFEQQERSAALGDRLGNWLHEQALSKQAHISLISTNYDVAIESTIFEALDHDYDRIASTIDFGIPWRSERGSYYVRPKAPQMDIFKLHGSLNWLRCEMCEHLYIHVKGITAQQAFREDIDENNTCHCGHAPLRAVLVTPSFVRDIREVNLVSVWRSSLEAMRLASSWIVIGYSFPAEDIAIKSLFLRAYHGTGENAPPSVRVILRKVNGKPDEAAEARYKLFFPECKIDYCETVGFIDEVAPVRRPGESARKARMRQTRRGVEDGANTSQSDS